jgi:hypothetical protein
MHGEWRASRGVPGGQERMQCNTGEPPGAARRQRDAARRHDLIP